MTTAEIKDIIAELENINLSTYPIDHIQKCLAKLTSVPMMGTELNIGCPIFRARPNDGEKSFTNKSEVSYKPQDKNHTYQRASTPQRTMFYGAWIPSDHKEYEVAQENVIALSETSNLIRNDQSDDGQELLTLGKWRVKRQISLATIQFLDEEHNVTPYLRKISAKTIAWLKNEYPGHLEQAILVNNYFAKVYSKSDITGDYDYIISALLTENFTHHGLDGVVYPSIRIEQKGLNVAFLPDVADNCLRLEGVAECRIYKKSNRIISNNEKVAFLHPGESSFELRALEIGKDRVSDEHIQNMLNR